MKARILCLCLCLFLLSVFACDSNKDSAPAQFQEVDTTFKPKFPPPPKKNKGGPPPLPS